MAGGSASLWHGLHVQRFGMLVQAKQIHRRGCGRSTLNFGCRAGEQAEHLQEAVETLSVPAVYALHLGGTVLRSDSPPRYGGRHGVARKCLRCRQQSVSMLPAAVAATEDSSSGCGEFAFEHTVPLEDLSHHGLHGSGYWLAQPPTWAGRRSGSGWYSHGRVRRPWLGRSPKAAITRQARELDESPETLARLPALKGPRSMWWVSARSPTRRPS